MRHNELDECYLLFTIFTQIFSNSNVPLAISIAMMPAMPQLSYTHRSYPMHEMHTSSTEHTTFESKYSRGIG